MSDREVVNLIFLPGFSTAEKVTNVSGRGVGMDVVKTNIEKIGGTVDIQSTHGQGTTLQIKIPLTLAIIPALIVTSGGERYAIPQVSLLELVRLEGEQAAAGIETSTARRSTGCAATCCRWCTSTRELGLEPAARPHGEAIVNIVVLQADDRQFGLVVDAINDTEEIVVKPLSKQLKGIAVFAGATIMGDGRVALILDVLGLAQQAGVIAEMREQTLPGGDDERRRRAGRDRRRRCCCSGPRRQPPDGHAAVAGRAAGGVPCRPRSSARARREVVQYRGEILPLIHLSSVFAPANGRPRATTIRVQGDRLQPTTTTAVGLVVDESSTSSETVSSRVGGRAATACSASAVIQQRVTDVLDVQAIVADSTAVSGCPAGRHSVQSARRQTQGALDERRWHAEHVSCTFYVGDLLLRRRRAAGAGSASATRR